MNAQKIAGLIGILLAIVGAFVSIPYAAAILLILGLFIGLSIIPDHHIRVMTAPTGPKISSCATRISFLTPERIVGLKK